MKHILPPLLVALVGGGCCADDPQARDVSGLPPLIDEVDAFEARLRVVLPAGWTIDRHLLRQYDTSHPIASRPWFAPEARAWMLSTPWPGSNQRFELFLFLFEKGTSAPPDLQPVGVFERFAVLAQDPSVASIGGARFDWATMPGWPGARQAIERALAGP